MMELEDVLKVARGLAYTTAKFTKIIDWRLAVFYHFLQVAVLVGVVLSLVIGKTFLEVEYPIGIVSSFGMASASYAQIQDLTYAGNLTTPCANLNDYKFQYDESFAYNSPVCSYLSADELIRKSPSGSVFVSTHIENKRIYRTPAASKEACPDVALNGLGVNKTDEGFSYSTGTCTYRDTKNLFTVGVEGVAIELLHAYDTMSGKYSGANPKTFVRRKGSDVNYKIITGKAVKLTIAELLDFAGVDLDKPIDQQPSGYKPPGALKGVGFSEGKYPYPRLTGNRLVVDIKYYNFKLEQSGMSNTDVGTNEVYAILEVNPTYAWTSRGQDISYRSTPTDWSAPFSATGQPQGAMEDMYAYGIDVDVSATGLLGQFNFILFIQTVIGGLVFLGSAKTVCDLVATNGLGIKSKLYQKFIREEVDLERECARYAIQALVATHFFNSKDVDGTGTLDLTEMQGMLRDTFNRKPLDEGSVKADTGSDGDGSEDILDESEISALALYVLRSCDMNRHKNRLAGKDEAATVSDIAASSINLTEFINIFTSDTVDVAALKEIVKLTNLDEQVAAMEEEQKNQV